MDIPRKDVCMNAVDTLEKHISEVRVKSLEMKTLELSNLLKQRLQFYKEENAMMESVFKSLNLLNEDLKLNSSIVETLDELSKIQQKLKLSELSSKSLVLSHTERLRKQSNYLSKLKICIKIYMHLNETLSKEIKTAKWELDQSKSTIDSLTSTTPEEIKAMEIKVKRYENELVKFEKRYPWLKEPDFNLPNISKEMETLKNLRQERDKLSKELSVYHGLKPNIKEATEQLAKIKLENQQVCDKLLEIGK